MPQQIRPRWRRVQAGQTVELECADGPAVLEPTDLVVTPRTANGWAGLADRGTQLLLDVRITPELAGEGMAREVIRHVQNSPRTPTCRWKIASFSI